VPRFFGSEQLAEESVHLTSPEKEKGDCGSLMLPTIPNLGE
jgi:hypothetical protein